MLTQPEVVTYLIRRRLVSAKSIAAGDLSVVDVSRRNRNFAVISQRGPCYLLKQGLGEEGKKTVSNEAVVYQLFQSTPGYDEAECYLPRYCEYDQDEHVLILELLRDAQNLREYHARRGYFSTRLALALGKALGTVHSLVNVKEDNRVGRTTFNMLPWILSLHRPDLRMLRDLSNANIQLIKIIQRSAELGHALEGLRKGWRNESFIHNDIKWDNCLAFSSSASGRKTRLKIVDWETAYSGDPCWDVGSVFNDYLSFWMLSVPVMGQAPPDRFMKQTRYPLERMQPAIRAFWRSYVDRMELDTETADEWLLRAVKYGAARLVQTAYENMHMSIKLTSNIVCLLQLSLNIMQRPQEAAVRLLGIPLG